MGDRIRKWIAVLLAGSILAMIQLVPAGGAVFVRENIENKEILGEKETSLQQTLHARAWVLMDADSGRILAEKDADTAYPMASTTKILTCILALEQGNPDDWVGVSEKAASMPDVQLNMRAGERYRLSDLLYSLMLESHNDSAVAVAEHTMMLILACAKKLVFFDRAARRGDYDIRSRVKGVYSEINALLAGSTDDELTGKYHEVLAQLPAMKELYGHRARLRKERGCMDIESGEVKLILDEDGHCIDVKKRTSGESEAMIEEFMLLANQCAAHFARVKQIPFVYRVHEEPNAEKLERLHGLLQACGVNDHFAKDVPTPKELSAILEGVRGTAYEQIINTGMLRCMSKAVYEEKPKGHYGLVLQDYAHFTSPIRRYPDLAIHRIMTAQLKGTDKDTMILRYSEFAEDVSKQASEREVIAMQIERKAEDCYKAEYARRHLGECYEGRISGVTQRGLFIELENGVEGFVPASSLTATGTMLTEGVRLSDPVSGKNWNLGDTMMITIVRADVNLGKIDFEVAPESAKQ